MAKLIKLPDIQNLDLKPGKTQEFYEKEAKNLLRGLNANDKNFKHFIFELIRLTKRSVETETWRILVSDLQKYICNRINEEEQDTYDGMVPLRNDIKTTKKTYFEKFSQ